MAPGMASSACKTFASSNMDCHDTNPTFGSSGLTAVSYSTESALLLRTSVGISSSTAQESLFKRAAPLIVAMTVTLCAS